MNKTYCFFLLLLSTSLYSQTTWERIYGGANYDRANAFIPTSDGNFIIGGSSSSFGDNAAYLSKIDEYGNLLWERTFDFGNSIDKISAITATQNNNEYLAVGKSNSNNCLSTIPIVKFNGFGDTLWTKKFCGSEFNMSQVTDIISMNDGTFLLSGAALGSRAMLLNIDQDGNEIWFKEYLQFGYGAINDILITSDNNLLTIGHDTPTANGNDSIRIMKTNLVGEIQWDVHFGGSWECFGHSGIELAQ